MVFFEDPEVLIKLLLSNKSNSEAVGLILRLIN